MMRASPPASGRRPEVGALLARWHTEQAERAAHWRPAAARSHDATLKTFFALLLGLCQIESSGALFPREDLP